MARLRVELSPNGLGIRVGKMHVELRASAALQPFLEETLAIRQVEHLEFTLNVTPLRARVVENVLAGVLGTLAAHRRPQVR